MAYNNDSSDDDLFEGIHNVDIQGYRFEPYASESESSSVTSDSEDSDFDDRFPENHEHRLDNLDWCRCSSCEVMASEEECVCCREINNVIEKEREENMRENCITEHPKFRMLCLDRDVLGVAAITVSSMLRTVLPDPLTDRFFRLTAYRQFTLWIHGKLGKANRRVIPACVVKKIRQQYPNLEPGQTDYVGYVDP